MDPVLSQMLPDEILALTIYGEARGESIDGQVAVGNVIVNRWQSNPKKYKTVREVCLEDFQFSCWNEIDANYLTLVDLARKLVVNAKVNMSFTQCLYIARGVLGANFLDNTKGCLHYMTYALFKSPTKPNWAKGSKSEVTIGNHVFFNV